MAQLSSRIIFYVAVLLPLVAAQYDEPGSSGSNPHGGTSSYSSPSSNGSEGGYNYKDSASFKKSTRILIVHAALGTLAWAVFAPLSAILIRLNIPGANLLRVHIICQVSVYAMTIATTGLGVWLAIGASKYGSVWTNSHVIIGLLVFSVANIQPWLGCIHHIVFKRRLIKYRKDVDTKRPGRTPITIAHIWIGRILILLGVINGGLGISLAATTPFQTESTSRKAEVAYGVIAGLMFLLFASVSVVFEHRRTSRIRAQKQTQHLSSRSHGQESSAIQRFMPFSPMSSENSLEYEEKGSEIGR